FRELVAHAGGSEIRVNGAEGRLLREDERRRHARAAARETLALRGGRRAQLELRLDAEAQTMRRAFPEAPLDAERRVAAACAVGVRTADARTACFDVAVERVRETAGVDPLPSVLGRALAGISHALAVERDLDLVAAPALGSGVLRDERLQRRSGQRMD